MYLDLETLYLLLLTRNVTVISIPPKAIFNFKIFQIANLDILCNDLYHFNITSPNR